ncbi:isochorismatase family protein [Sandaracinobacteroides saxicola]|uniref:Isochorismatase family protein n=1 Tax=Sandaracinobacteroides saxicola TaxID=2759707 RepID=A0A7G5IE10_9SPHN|nr:isochorismatase family protein [Sandaracinobacteroides saxicola]QMW21602.1 isochorismatase family protein [Sandaracinobacteroides saxicola]
MRLNAAQTALLLIDLQPGSIAMLEAEVASDLETSVDALRRVADIHAVPIIATAGKRPEGSHLIAALDDLARIDRMTADAFDDGELANAVFALGRKTLITAGVATDIGVAFAVESAIGLGLDVVVPLDACATTTPIAAGAAQARLVQLGARIATVQAVAAGLMRRFDGPTAAATAPIIAALAEAANGRRPSTR